LRALLIRLDPAQTGGEINSQAGDRAPARLGYL
jgi:hypothetical protein